MPVPIVAAAWWLVVAPQWLFACFLREKHIFSGSFASCFDRKVLLLQLIVAKRCVLIAKMIW